MTRMQQLAGLALLILALPVMAMERGQRTVGYGQFDGVNQQRRWIVVNDTAMPYGPDFKVRDHDGSVIADITRIRTGTPVKYVGMRRGITVHVQHLRVLEELPLVVDQEGVVDQ